MKTRTLQTFPLEETYIGNYEASYQELKAAWGSGEKVKSLMVAIECAKVLDDTSIIATFPSKFVLSTEILDTLGALVHERIKEGIEVENPDSEVGSLAKEQCRNWFRKIACMRELLPRVYLETALLRCYGFLQSDKHTNFEEVLNRILATIRGIGNPLAATYARCYLARKAWEIVPANKEYFIRCFEDHLACSEQIDSYRITPDLEGNLITRAEYLSLYAPAVEWLFFCIDNNTQKALESLREKYMESKSALILKCIIYSFPSDFISATAQRIMEQIRDSDDCLPKHQLYRELGAKLVIAKPLTDQVFPILNEVWEEITKVEDITEYMKAAAVWIEYPLKYCTEKEVNALLQDVLHRVTADGANSNVQPHLQSLLQKVVTYQDPIVVNTLVCIPL